MLDTRFLLTGGGRRRIRSKRLILVMAFVFQQALIRSSIAACMQSTGVLVSLIQLQVTTMFLGVRCDAAAPCGVVYQLSNCGVPSIGQTERPLPQRVSEHYRELRAHARGTVPKRRKRRRYLELLASDTTRATGFVVLGIFPQSSLLAQEGTRIQLSQALVHGRAIKHLHQRFRMCTGNARLRKPPSMRHRIFMKSMNLRDGGNDLDSGMPAQWLYERTWHLAL